jgi:hypothetical protein
MKATGKRLGLATALVAAMLAPMLAGGCAPGSQKTGLTPESSLFGDSRVNPSGANHLIEDRQEVISEATIAGMLCDREPAPTDTLFAGLRCMNTARAGGSLSDAEYQRRRNDVQHTLMLVSDQRCALWMTYLLRAGAINRGSFSVLGTLTGGLAPLFSGGAAKVLGATSGIMAGTGSAIDAAMLHSLTEGVVVPKVLEMRKDQRDAIGLKQGKSPAEYPVAAAIEDAVLYHNSCSITSVLDPTARQETRSFLPAPARVLTDSDIRTGARMSVGGMTYFIISAGPSPDPNGPGGRDAQDVVYAVSPGDASNPHTEKLAQFRDVIARDAIVY